MTDQEIDPDPDDLERQLAAIKGAMDLEDRYPGQRRLWLGYGVAVALASVVTQVLFVVEELPAWGYTLVWAGLILVIGAAQWWLASRTATGPEPGIAPDWRVVFGTLVLGLVSLSALVDPLFPYLWAAESETTAGIMQGAYFFGLAVVLAGMGFMFTGTALAAYRIRRRDRWVFYGAGLWMLAFATTLTQSWFMRRTGYAVFGILFFVYSIAAYVVLGRGGATDT